MESPSSQENPVLFVEGTIPPREADYALSVAVVYQDVLTREWATHACGRATRVVGPEHIRSSWWKAKYLNHPRVYQDAVRATVLADVIMVAVWATRGVPRELSRWVDGWLAQRPRRVGALLALVGTPGPPGSFISPIHAYLRVVADMGQLDFLPHEFRASVDPLPLAADSNTDSAQTDSYLASQILSHEHASFWSRWGQSE